MSFRALHKFIKTHKEFNSFNHIQHKSCICKICKNAQLFVGAINRKVKVCDKKLPTKVKSIVEEFSFGITNKICMKSTHLVHYTTLVRREWDTSNTFATRTIQLQYEWKILILITTQMKTYFHIPMLTIRQMKDYKERNNVILRTTFWNCLVTMPKSVWKVHHKIWTMQWQKLYQKIIH